jgi:hypothetical protein
MDDRAYHLQNSAHAAVSQALKSGRLLRQPCEICGKGGQAHHDSYHPDRWLDVRWLCAAHHRAWHEANEPEWPTLYEFPLTDHGGHPDGGAGRPPKPWYWKARRGWYVTLRGKRYRLGADPNTAEARFRELVQSE